MSIFRHTHDYEAVAVEHVSTGPFSAAGTTILWRCKCAHVFSERIDGRWTLWQIRGESEPRGLAALGADRASA